MLLFLGTYKPYYFPLNFVFSYLWLTSFIFSAQDYNQSNYEGNAPRGGSCTLKLTNEAFIFLALYVFLSSYSDDKIDSESTVSSRLSPS